MSMTIDDPPDVVSDVDELDEVVSSGSPPTTMAELPPETVVSTEELDSVADVSVPVSELLSFELARFIPGSVKRKTRMKRTRVMSNIYFTGFMFMTNPYF